VDRPAALRAFNLTMAALLLLSLAPMLTSHAPTSAKPQAQAPAQAK
jgi:hypothetical protein